MIGRRDGRQHARGRGFARGVLGLAGTALVAVSGPAPAVAAGPCTDQREFKDGVYRYALCGVPDLDQVRPAADGFVGLGNSGRAHCVPTATMNFFAYLADRGYPHHPAPGDWRDPARYNDMTALIASMGSHMKTSPTKGTNRDNWLAGVKSWLGIPYPAAAPGSPLPAQLVTKTVAVGGTNAIDTDFESAKGYAPHPADVAGAAVNGDLVVSVIGFYGEKGPVKLLDGTYLDGVLERRSGHATTLVSANARPGTTQALLGIRDPASPWVADTVQSEYTTDTWSLDAVESQRRFFITTDEGTRVYDAAVPTVGGDDLTRFDGYMTLEPQRVVMWHEKAIKILTPQPTHPGDPVTRVIDAPGGRTVTDLALAPRSNRPVFLVKGRRTIYRADVATGRVEVAGQAPAGPGARRVAVGGAKEIVFAAAGRRLVALGRGGRVLRSVRLSAPVDDLQIDDARGRVLVLERGAEGLTVLDSRLRVTSRLRLAGRALDRGRGTASMALAPGGGVLVGRTGVAGVAVVPAATVRAAAARRPRTRTRIRRVRPRLRRFAVRPAGGAFALDDRGHVVVARGGKLVELTPGGKVVPRSPIAGLPGRGGMVMTRSFSNMPADFLLDDPRDLTRPFLAPPPMAAAPSPPPAPPPPSPAPEPTPEPPPTADPPPAPLGPDLVFGAAADGRFTVRNIGNQAAGRFTVALLGSRSVVERVPLRGLAAGATSDPMPYTCPADRTLRVAVDVDNEVEETAEDNNIATIDC